MFATSNKCLTSSNKKLVVTGATLVVTGALLLNQAIPAPLHPKARLTQAMSRATRQQILYLTWGRLLDCSNGCARSS